MPLYYTTIENLLFDFTINLCYTIIRKGRKEGLPPADKLEAATQVSWSIGAGSWISWELQRVELDTDELRASWIFDFKLELWYNKMG